MVLGHCHIIMEALTLLHWDVPYSSRTGFGTILQLHVLIVFILSSVSTDTHPFNNSKKPGRNLTIHSSQLVCSYPGPEGPPGQPGALGPPGIMGRMGAPGKDGLDGKDGEMGEKGERGDAGRPGNPGKPGLQGRMGLIGKAGARGLKGVRGAPGSAGTRGSKGDAGDAGEPGNGGGCNCGSRARSAFTVAVTKSYPKERTPIRFNRVLMNEGSHYNASSGKFVCSFPGIYYFTYDITLANKHLAIGLVHNGQYKIKTFDGNTGNNDVASGSTILRLKRDDQVWLQIFYSEQNGLFFDPYWTDSLFSGFLIYADQDFDVEEQKAGEGSR